MSDLLFKDGKLHINTKLITQDGAEILNYDNPEYAFVITDKNDNIIYGIKSDGEIVGNFPGNGSSSSSLSKEEKEYIEDSIRRFPNKKYLPLMQSLKRPYIGTGGYIRKDYKTLNIATLADIHGGTNGIVHFIDYINQFKNYIDDSIILGDIAGNQWHNYEESWDNLEGYHSILKVIGNHDIYYYYCTFTVSGVSTVPSVDSVYKLTNDKTFNVLETNITSGSGTIYCLCNGLLTSTTSGTLTKVSGTGDDTISFSGRTYSDATAEQCYERYMQGIETWGVVYSQNKCYYYKDYPDANIRLIVLDCMHDASANSEQTQWFRNVLMGENNENSALTLGYHVIVAQHVPATSEKGRTLWEYPGTNFDDSYFTHDTFAYTAVRNVIDDFQNDGGIFVTYMFGHYHIDMMGVCVSTDLVHYPDVNFPNQNFIVYPTGGSLNSHSDAERGESEVPNVATSATYEEKEKIRDNFTITSIDTQAKLIRLLKIGTTYNRHLMHTETIVISYENDHRGIVHYSA